MIVLPGTGSTSDPCRLAFDNLLEEGTVEASTEQDDYPVANIFNWIPSDFYKPTVGGTTTIDLTLDAEASANYLAFYNQDIYLHGGTVKLQYHDGADFVDAVTVTPTDNSPRLAFFVTKTSDRWRLVIECDEVFSLGVVAFGQYLSLQYGMYMGWTPPSLADDSTLLNSVSENGSFLGRSVIARGIRTSIELQYATDAWVRQYWSGFIAHAQQKPFFFAPHVVNYPTEVVFCWVEGDMPKPRHTHYGYMGCSIPIRGLIE